MENLIFTTLTPEQFQTSIAEAVKKEFETHHSQQPEPEELLTETEASVLLQVSKVTLKTWRDENRIKFLRIGRNRIRYKKSDLLTAPQKFSRVNR